MINVAVFFGGTSVEHEVSIITASQAIDVLRKIKGYNAVPIYIDKEGDFYTGSALFDIEEFRNIPMLLSKLQPCFLVRGKIKSQASLLVGKDSFAIDLAFPIVHGTGGEDGTLQGLFEMLDIPYIGCNPLAASITMDKVATKAMLRSVNIRVANDYWFYVHDFRKANLKSQILSRVLDTLNPPYIVKPADVGSSVGVSSVENKNIDDLTKAIEFASLFSTKIIVEEKVQNLKEINISLCGDVEHIETTVCESPLSQSEFLTYEEKYMDSGSKGMAAQKRIIPADISPELTEKIRETAILAYKTIGCAGVTRIDFLYDKVAKELYICELNTIPGSLSFYLWEATGVSFENLILKLIDAAKRSFRRRKSLLRSTDFNLLQKDNLKGVKK